MSNKTLTDELRSVLLYHSLEAPQPHATVDRILNDTVGPVVALGGDTATTGADTSPRRRLPVQQLVAASVVGLLLVTVAGINSVRNHNTAQTASQAGQARQNEVSQPDAGAAADGSMGLPQSSYSRGKAAPATPPEHVGNALDCSTIPGGKLITGKWDQYTLSTGQRGYLYEFLCVGPNGQRSASEVQVFRQTGNSLDYTATLLRADFNQHLDYITGGLDSVRIQTSVYSPVGGGVPGEVISMAWELNADGSTDADGSGATVAEPCLRKDLTPTVTELPDAAVPSWLLAMRNRSDRACALEGIPRVRAERNDASLATAALTMSGVAGGITESAVPPIIVLPPQGTASAIIEQGTAATAECQLSDQLAVTLPNGVSLGKLPAQLPGCGLVVHPLVGNARGSD